MSEQGFNWKNVLGNGDAAAEEAMPPVVAAPPVAPPTMAPPPVAGPIAPPAGEELGAALPTLQQFTNTMAPPPAVAPPPAMTDDPTWGDPEALSSTAPAIEISAPPTIGGDQEELSAILSKIKDMETSAAPPVSITVDEEVPMRQVVEEVTAAPIAPPVEAVAPPVALEEAPTFDAPTEVDAETIAFDEGIEWKTPVVAPEPPKVEPQLVESLPGAPSNKIYDEPIPDYDEEIPKSSYQRVDNPAEPPKLHVPIVPPPAITEEPKSGGLTTPTDEMTAFKQAAREAGMPTVDELHIDEILRVAVERKASDIHLTVGLPPMARIDGEVVPLPWAPLDSEQTRRLVYDVLNNEQLEKFERTHELDFGHSIPAVGRFRFNVYMQRGSVAGAMRTIPNKIPEFESLGLPGVIREMAKRTSGLVLVTGPTGSGKSTTIATIIDDINRTRKGHIITIEDPIEYLHQHRQCMVNQRELHSDTYSFHNALRAILREDPDIILVGELRDLETIEAALTLAETGHLVFGTLHTRNAPSTIDRIIDVFPKDAQEQIRVLLSNTLEGVISQQLLPRIGGGRRASIEIMIATPAIKNLIREGKTHQMYSSIETSGNIGMQTMDATLAELYRSGQCDYEECLMRAIDKESFARLAKRA